jgi:Enoyl-CoA hydratase/isomerase
MSTGICQSLRLADPGDHSYMDYSSYQHLVFEQRPHGVLLITLNRPEVLNAADEVMHGELARVWSEVSRDEDVRVAVVTGAGRAFSAGGDLAMVERAALRSRHGCLTQSAACSTMKDTHCGRGPGRAGGRAGAIGVASGYFGRAVPGAQEGSRKPV